MPIACAAGHATSESPGSEPRCAILQQIGWLFFEGISPSEARACDPAYEGTLVRMLLDPGASDLTHANAAWVLGMMGGELASRALRDFILHDRHAGTYELSTAGMALGNLVQRTAEEPALAFLLRGIEVESSSEMWQGRGPYMERFMVVCSALGLAVSGDPRAHAALEELRARTPESDDLLLLNSASVESFVRWNERMAREGLDRFYSKDQ